MAFLAQDEELYIQILKYSLAYSRQSLLTAQQTEVVQYIWLAYNSFSKLILPDVKLQFRHKLEGSDPPLIELGTVVIMTSNHLFTA